MTRISIFLISLFLFNIAAAQDNYEIQVYASPTQAKGSTMFELHSNYTFNGQKNIIDGVRPSNHALHETLEITTGITDNFEIGFYFFTNYTSTYGYKYVGSHIRPRVSVPEKWHWPFGASLSMEIGFQSSEYAEDTWSIEIRPILDKQFNTVYISFNPTFGIGLKGSNDHTPSFEPNLKASYSFNKVALGFEYYGSIGQVDNVPSLSQQNHSLFAVADLNIDPRWEFNFGPGWGLTNNTDDFVFKLIVGRRITWRKTADKATTFKSPML
ncbi:MAG TPA: hypothetical protein VNS50_12480 [Ginsengibacter sp.]|nr:hypothetical protein [Ginsengibacter sp.]